MGNEITKELIDELKHFQKLVSKEEFEQEGQCDDSGFYKSGTFIKSKIVKSKISRLINRILEINKNIK